MKTRHKQQSDENFPVASLFISKSLRPLVADYYAFARRCDDIADNPDLLPEEKLVQLREISDIFYGVKKYRGSLPICVGKYITDLLDGRDDIDNSMVFISSCQPKPGCMEAIKAGLRKYGKFENIIETDIGTTIGHYSRHGYRHDTPRCADASSRHVRHEGRRHGFLYGSGQGKRNAARLPVLRQRDEQGILPERVFPRSRQDQRASASCRYR